MTKWRNNSSQLTDGTPLENQDRQLIRSVHPRSSILSYKDYHRTSIDFVYSIASYVSLYFVMPRRRIHIWKIHEAIPVTILFHEVYCCIWRRSDFVPWPIGCAIRKKKLNYARFSAYTVLLDIIHALCLTKIFGTSSVSALVRYQKVKLLRN